MHALFKGEVFRGRQRAARGEMRSIIGSDERFKNIVTRLSATGFLETPAEVFGHVFRHAHGTEYHAEAFGGIFAELGLANNLRSKLVVAHAGAGENRQLLPADKRNKRVDRRDARADVVARVGTAHRVDGAAVDICKFFGVNRAETIHRLTRPVENTAHNLVRQRKAHGGGRKSG